LPRLNPAAGPGISPASGTIIPEGNLSKSYFFFFLGAFFFISLFNFDLDLAALLGAFFRTPGIDTSYRSAAAGVIKLLQKY